MVFLSQHANVSMLLLLYADISLLYKANIWHVTYDWSAIY